MEALRDMYVGITLKDEASRDLDRIDRKMDDIKYGFQQMGIDADEAAIGFSRMGISGSRAMDGIEDAADELKDEIRNLADQVALLSLTSEAAFASMEDDIDDVSGEVRQLERRINFATAKTVMLGTALTTAFVGGVAASAPLLAGVGALAASLGAAGIGAAAFGAVAVGALKGVFDAQEDVAKLQEKIANADNAKERIKAQKELAELYAGMSKEQRALLKDLQSFKAFWGDFVKEFEKPVFESFGLGLQFVQEVLGELKPTISNVAGVVVELMEELNDAVYSSGFQNFFDWLETNASESLYNFAHIFGNTFMGIVNILQAFAPVGASLEEWLVRTTQRFEEWSAGLSQSTSFQNFVGYVKENGPILADTLSNIWDIVVELVRSLAPLGSEVLQGFQSLTEYISTNIMPIFDDIAGKATDFVSTIRDNWGPIKETVIGLGTAFLTFKGVMMGMKIIETVTGLINSLRTVTSLATFAQWALNTAMAANPAVLIAAGIAALVGVGILLYRNWDTLKNKAIELWDKMGFLKQVVLSLLGPFRWVADAVSFLLKKWDAFKNSISNFKMPKFGLPKWMGGNGLIQFPGHATGLSRVPFDDYVARLHKDETVLRADQSRVLEEAGILDRSGSTPRINSLGASPSPTNSVSSGGSPIFSPSVNIYISSGDVESVGSLEAAINKKLEEMWQSLLDIYRVKVER
ncbi:hypothetical protein P9850_02090 [Anoxybacillus rupiensis]|uniref:Phage-related protein n=1 Tax=Anoxybacteroides rupiense TaxID=311460 RepID=A0ABD5IT44_9BACL|nr:hypothetical protein [Anoxybacillus rupiensis]